MAAAEAPGLALIVRRPPWHQRAARADLDLALAAMAMDIPLEVYFLGAALLQLARERDSRDALLPPGYRAWASLGDHAEVAVFAEQQWLDRCASRQIPLILRPRPLSRVAMTERWRCCRHVVAA
jgi:sulfur relay (sulfurtransferase) DsrF/TusC family protein